MRRPVSRLAVLGGLAILGFNGVSCGVRETPEEAVVASFQRFVAAVAAAEGDDAADEVSADTLELFQEVVDRSLEEDGLRGASAAMRLAVYAARESWSESTRRGMDGEDLFAAMIDEGWVSPYTGGELAFEILELDGVEATIAVGAPNRTRRPRLKYVEDADGWRLDLTASRRDADRIANDIFRYGGSVNELETVRAILGS